MGSKYSSKFTKRSKVRLKTLMYQLVNFWIICDVIRQVSTPLCCEGKDFKCLDEGTDEARINTLTSLVLTILKLTLSIAITLDFEGMYFL